MLYHRVKITMLLTRGTWANLLQAHEHEAQGRILNVVLKRTSETVSTHDPDISMCSATAVYQELY
jgi:hypothetical protein